MKTNIAPGLFGQKHSSHDYTKAESWGKNQFNSSFPASLVAYMYSKDMIQSILDIVAQIRQKKPSIIQLVKSIHNVNLRKFASTQSRTYTICLFTNIIPRVSSKYILYKYCRIFSIRLLYLQIISVSSSSHPAHPPAAVHRNVFFSIIILFHCRIQGRNLRLYRDSHGCQKLHV